MPKEVWRPVLGYVMREERKLFYADYYEVSNMGNVRSVDREVGGRGGSTRTVKGKLLSPRRRPDGTLAVNLWIENEYEQKPVKRLVLEAFGGRPQPNGYDAKNIDEDPSNCKLSNLRWEPVGGLAMLRRLTRR